MSRSAKLTTLFADVSGSTRLFELKGDTEARRLIAAVLASLAEVCVRHDGTVVKTIGDEIMCTFADAPRGVQAAIEMQRHVVHYPVFAAERLGIRIGLHHGSALVEDGDVFGDSVNVAARMAAMAKREQIVTTTATLRAVKDDDSLRTRSLGWVRVAGKSRPMEVFDILWPEDRDDLTMVQTVPNLDPAEAGQARLRLVFRDREIELNESSPPFSIGRDATSSLVVQTEWASRNHVVLEYKKGFFTVIDRSTNGTFVRVGDDEELRVHWDEMHLRKSGSISLGQRGQADPENVVRFECGR